MDEPAKLEIAGKNYRLSTGSSRSASTDHKQSNGD
jgi:hypothetical protein